jgi:hypothetical protein
MVKGLKKLAFFILAIVVLLIIAVVLFIKVYGDRTLKYGIETAGEKALKVDVRVEDLSLAILAGKLNIDGLAVDNPQGYQQPTFLEAGHLYTALNTKSLLSDTIEIEQIKLDGINVVLEQKGMTNNIKELLANLPKSDAPKTESDKAGKNVLVKDLEISNVKVNITLLPGVGRATTLTLPLSTIHLTNLGSENKMDTAALVKEIITAIAENIAKQGKGLIPTDVLDSISGELGQALLKARDESLKQVEGVGQQIMDSGKNIGEEAKGILKGFIPKKED